MKTRFFPLPPPKRGFFHLVRHPAIIGHRGSPSSSPENTLFSFKEGMKYADGLELDVGMTKDGVIVVIHDDSLDRTTDGRGPIRDKTYQEIKRFDAGYRFEREASYPFRKKKITIPTLEELLKAFPRIPLIIEVKGYGEELALNIARIISSNSAQERVLLAGKDDKTMASIRTYLPDVQTGTSLREGILFYLLVHLGLAIYYPWKFQALCIPPYYHSIPLLTSPLLLVARGLGLPIYLWTINSREEIERYLSLGVEGIISDYPERVRESIKKKGLKEEEKR